MLGDTNYTAKKAPTLRESKPYFAPDERSPTMSYRNTKYSTSEAPRIVVRPPMFQGDCGPARSAAGDLDPASVRPGDTVGRLLILAVNVHTERDHGWPCRCAWSTCRANVHDDCCCTLPARQTVTWSVRCMCGWEGVKSAGFSALTCGRMNPLGSCLTRVAVTEAA
jgi:hypothetical protein